MPQQSIKKISSNLFILRLLRMSLSMVTLIFSAKYFGISIERDIWILVTTFLLAFGQAVWGPLNETFRAKFIFLREEKGELYAVSSTMSLVTFIIIVTIILSLVILFLNSRLAIWLSSDIMSAEKISLFIMLLVIMIPTLMINQLTSIGISILNAYDIYYLPEVIGAISSIINIFIIILLAPRIGIFSLAISQYVAILLLLSAIVYYLKRIHFPLSKRGFSFDYKLFLPFLVFSVPFFPPYFAGQCNVLVEKWLAGFLGEGYISSLDYARQFTMVLQSVVSSVLTTVMIPMLAKAYIQNEQVQYQKILSQNLSVCFAILALAIPVLYGAAGPICEFFFLRGKMSVNSLQLIISLMRIYALAFVGIVLYMFSGYALLASDRGKKYAFCGVTVQITILMINFFFVNKLGVYIFPISLGIVHFLGAFWMATWMIVDKRRILLGYVLKYSMIICLMTFLVWLFNVSFKMESAFIQLLFNFPILLFLFLLLSKGLDLDLMAYVYKFIQRKA